jgi:hypothetical protein
MQQVVQQVQHKKKGGTMPQFSTYLVCLLYHEGRSPEYIAKHLRTTVESIEAILQANYTGEAP